MKLNLGCGLRHRDGWVNVDSEAACRPDRVVDLEALPWPFPDDSVDEVHMSHVLEHLGARTAVFLGIFRELYRICRPGARIEIKVPHPRHDAFLIDPTHVRPITLQTLQMFDQAKNIEWATGGFSNTPLGVYLGVDLRIVAYAKVLDPAWKRRHDAGEVSTDELRHAMRSYNNVVEELQATLEVVKPGRAGGARDATPR